MVKKLLIIGASVLGLLAAGVLALAFFLDANQFRPALESAMSKALGRPVTISNLSVAVFSGGIGIDGLTIGDDPAFSREPFLKAKAVKVGVELMPLILSRSLRVESFRLERPEVTLLRSSSGTWNVSSLGAASPASPRSQEPGTAAAVSVFVRTITIANGRVVVANVAKDRVEHTYDDLNLEVSNLSFTSPFTFQGSVKTPGGGSADLNGQAGPFNRNDATATPFQAQAAITHLDAAATGLLDEASGIRGLLDFAGQLASDGTVMTTKGKATATNVQALPGGAPAGVPVVVDYGSSYNTKTKRGALMQGDVHVGAAAARLTGDYDASAKTVALRLRLVGQKMAVTALQAALPAVGVTLPSGAALTQGTLDSDLTISGPVDRLVITGPLDMANATLTGFDLTGKLGALASFAGLPKASDTVIETLAARLRVTPDGIAADALEMSVPTIGTLTGAGTIAANGAMDFRMLAKLKGGRTPAVTGVSAVVAFSQRDGIPFRIGGTTSNPTFAPDLGAVSSNVKSGLADAVKNPDTLEKASKALGNLFNRKK
jgi:AsmA protein